MRELGYDEILGILEHLLLTEAQLAPLLQKAQISEHGSHLEYGATFESIQVILVSSRPVCGHLIDIPLENLEHLAYLFPEPGLKGAMILVSAA